MVPLGCGERARARGTPPMPGQGSGSFLPGSRRVTHLLRSTREASAQARGVGEGRRTGLGRGEGDRIVGNLAPPREPRGTFV